jgi:hypothetical protein
MNRNIYILTASLLVFFSSCIGSSDYSSVDEEWMFRNDKEFYAEAANPEYSIIYGIADPYKYILWKESTCWEGSAITDPEVRANMPSPTFSDTIKCRYDGWYKDASGKQIIFDSTERHTSYSLDDPNKVARIMQVSSLIDGWRVALYQMKEGDEWRIVIPYYLGYGMTENGNIPACTNLYFDLKLLEIVSKSN